MICPKTQYNCLAAACLNGCLMADSSNIVFTPFEQHLYGSWQCCPVCGGSGQSAFGGTFNTSIPICKVCNGKGIISTLNGLPPA
jgi:DnaJ-class molecular chaperone